MKRIGLTQRVELASGYDERRDSLDQRWHSLLLFMGMLPVPLPNVDPSLTSSLVDGLGLDGVLFTGGNSLCGLSPNDSSQAYDRDKFELSLIADSVKNMTPIFGVCRGMQIINRFFGGTVVPITDHVAQHHEIISIDEKIALPKIVNSFHEWSIQPSGLGTGLVPIATDLDGNVEAFMHSNQLVGGVMWHPERDQKFHPLNIKFIGDIFL